MDMVKDDIKLHQLDSKHPRDVEKNPTRTSGIKHYEHDDDRDEKAQHRENMVNMDYSGAHKKTDPAEIALVKKLDRYIMPT